MDEISEILMSLPRSPTFATQELALDQAKALQQVEKKLYQRCWMLNPEVLKMKWR